MEGRHNVLYKGDAPDARNLRALEGFKTNISSASPQNSLPGRRCGRSFIRRFARLPVRRR